MPSPFPGMDPYLENPEFFPGLHDRLINELSIDLQKSLPPAFYAEIRSRVWVEYVERPFEPDVNVLRSPRRVEPPDNGVETVVGVGADPVVVVAPEFAANDEDRELYAEIYTVRGERRLVTAIEVLSPSNKARGTDGRHLYIRKQRELIDSKTHLVEIDLLRGGAFTTAVPRKRAFEEAGLFDYHVCIHRYDQLGKFFVYPILLRQRLPKIAIPLSPGDDPVVLDLQAVFERCYDAGPYARLSPYVGRTPEPPLSPEDAAWATQRLRERGLLPPA
jgi:Protein of unknown function (DUF4058)